MSNEEIKRAILEMDEREELAKDMLEQVSSMDHRVLWGRWQNNGIGRGESRIYCCLQNV